jgi:NTE family protein
MLTAQNNPKIGICLSGGAALGYAHIGVLQALEENGIYPEVISGSSMGAIIGALYAAGYSPQQMMQISREEKMYRISNLLSPSFSIKGFANHKTLRKLLKEMIPQDNFDSLKKEYYLCVSNLTNATWKTVGHGPLLHEYIVASASIPGVFEANVIEGQIYVDGGLFNNLPAQVIRDKCDVLIGVDVLPYYEKTKIKKTTEVLGLSIRAVQHLNSKNGRDICDFLIESPAIEKYSEFSFDEYEAIYKAGYDATIEYIKNNPQLLNYAKNKTP